MLVLGVAGLFAWGSLQPRPEGFAVVDAGEAVAVDEEPGGEPADTEEGPLTDATPVETVPAEEEAVRYTLDARSLEDWVLFDFVEGRVVEGDFASPGWDVAFQRTKLLTNSGVTNLSGPGGTFDLGEVDLEAASPPAEVSFVVDALGGEDEDEPENPAAGHWYSYSFISHIVSAKPNTYLIRTGEDFDALVQFDSYYCEDEEAGCITFRYRLIPKVSEDVS
ncbi:MAG: HmuY family protein [Actinomycetota bacterium]|nr:HmuY family protein [Actinomycetota bacterium]